MGFRCAKAGTTNGLKADDRLTATLRARDAWRMAGSGERFNVR
jgi:hypothetical protein